MLSDPGFRELISLPLSPAILHGLTRAGFNCVSEVVGLSVDRLATICGVNTKAARSALDIVHRYNQSSIECMDMNSIGLFGLCTAWDLLGTLQTVDENSPVKGKRYNYIVSMCRSFDDLLGGGFPTGRLTELCGEPGVGKTQFCLQACVNVQIPKWFSGLNGQALFLDTEGNFIPERVRQIASALADHCKHHYIESNPEKTDESFIKQYCPTVESLMSGIHYIRITDHLKLLAVCRHLEQFCDQHPLIRLIVVDSIALPFRYDFDDIPQRNRLLASVTQMLLCVAGRQQAAVILTNQITTKFDAKNLNSEQFDCVMEEEKVVKEQCRNDQNSYLVPALGDSWGHICSLRVFLTRLTTGVRQVKLLKHPGRPYGVGYYQITTGGIRDLVQNNKCNKHLPE
ncbi:unnamed protein product [Schistosoma mattheei]|uniref:Rad51-like C-terminal domain-containing protein n=1 Tax=Schistosoma mattheei TaxID=31246 RepID=A0AA85BVZ2_9TREM|nr:unnamed protein product [Schistosoma mattheei]